MKAINDNGTVRTYNSLPRNWKNVINFIKADVALQEEMGFFNVQAPTLTEYEKVEPLIVADFNGTLKLWEQRKRDFTVEEIILYDQNKLDTDASAVKQSTYTTDGIQQHTRIWEEVMRALDDTRLTAEDFDILSGILYDAILPLTHGLWKVSQVRVNATSAGTGALAIVRTWVKTKIDDYVTANY